MWVSIVECVTRAHVRQRCVYFARTFFWARVQTYNMRDILITCSINFYGFGALFFVFWTAPSTFRTLMNFGSYGRLEKKTCQSDKANSQNSPTAGPSLASKLVPHLFPRWSVVSGGPILRRCRREGTAGAQRRSSAVSARRCPGCGLWSVPDSHVAGQGASSRCVVAATEQVPVLKPIVSVPESLQQIVSKSNRCSPT